MRAYHTYRKTFWRVKAAGTSGWKLYHIHVPIFLKFPSLNFLEHFWSWSMPAHCLLYLSPSYPTYIYCLLHFVLSLTCWKHTHKEREKRKQWLLDELPRWEGRIIKNVKLILYWNLITVHEGVISMFHSFTTVALCGAKPLPRSSDPFLDFEIWGSNSWAYTFNCLLTSDVVYSVRRVQALLLLLLERHLNIFEIARK